MKNFLFYLMASLCATAVILDFYGAATWLGFCALLELKKIDSGAN